MAFAVCAAWVASQRIGGFPTEQIAEITRYKTELSRFTHSCDGIGIGCGDDRRFRQYVQELLNLGRKPKLTLHQQRESFAKLARLCKRLCPFAEYLGVFWP